MNPIPKTDDATIQVRLSGEALPPDQAFESQIVDGQKVTQIVPICSFDYGEIEAMLGEIKQTLPEREFDGMAEAMRVLIKWVIDWGATRKKVREKVGERLIGLAWAMDPAHFEGKSLRGVAKEYGISTPEISIHAAQARDDFGFKHGGTGHDWRRKSKSTDGIVHDEFKDAA